MESHCGLHQGLARLCRCYAEKITKRFPKTFPNGFDLTLRPELIDLPKHWRRPRVVFVNSMSDLFHAQVPEAFIQQVFTVMAECPQHTFPPARASA